MQQSYARVSGIKEIIHVSDLVEAALRMNGGALLRHGVRVIRDFGSVPPINVDKHKVPPGARELDPQRQARLPRNPERADKQLTVRASPMAMASGSKYQ